MPVLTPEDHDVRLDLPADLRHLTTLRVLASSLGADAGMTMRELDDLRLAVDEMFALLVEASEGAATVQVGFRATRDGLHVHARSSSEDAEPDVDELTARILDAVVDAHASGLGWMSLYKRRMAPAEPTSRSASAP